MQPHRYSTIATNCASDGNKLGPLLAQVEELMVPAARDPRPTKSVVGIVLVLPVPLVTRSAKIVRFNTSKPYVALHESAWLQSPAPVH
jgi:hypothetical protein